MKRSEGVEKGMKIEMYLGAKTWQEWEHIRVENHTNTKIFFELGYDALLNPVIKLKAAGEEGEL